MKLKENIKRFWTLSKSRKGFTLVELIVVIAILAILAGVAIPVYNGYIKKAEAAGDQQLADSISTAFAAACLTNGYNQVQAAGTTLRVNADGTIASGDPADYNFTIRYDGAAMAAADAAKIEATFATFFAGNEEEYFKSESFKNGLILDAKGNFVSSEVASGNMTQAQIQAAVDRYVTSNLYGNEESLVESVGTLTGMLGQMIQDGFDISGYMDGDYASFVEKYNLEGASGAETANALIMYSASKMQGVTAQDIADLTSGDFSNVNVIMDEYGTLPTAAMLYGVVTGYANSEYASESFKASYQATPNGVSDVLNLVTTMTNDGGFEGYYGNSGEKGMTADLEGYLAAMEVINGHDGTFDLSDPNAFTSEETMALLNGLLGK